MDDLTKQIYYIVKKGENTISNIYKNAHVNAVQKGVYLGNLGKKELLFFLIK